MIKLIGKKIISGDLNLTRISFPIKAMVPKTALYNSTLGCTNFLINRFNDAIFYGSSHKKQGSSWKNEIYSLLNCVIFLLYQYVSQTS